MPTLTGGQLASLRTYPHRSNTYLIVQQPMVRESGAWVGYLWSAQINGNPAGTAGDLVASLTVDNGDAGPTDILSGMTVMIGTNKGDHDKGIYVLRIGQAATGATVNLDIGSTSNIIDNVENDDWVVVLDEFRLFTRYPSISEAGGVISWFKDFDISYVSLGATAEERRQASLPPVPIMGPPAVAFIDQDGTVDINFDWSDSYASSPGATIDAWDSEGTRGTTSGNWVSALENPPDQTYDGSSSDPNNDISGLAGYRTELILGTDQKDSPARFRRGIRYVFTLRKPGESVDGIDPPNAEPITDFSFSSATGSYDDGGWTTTVTVFGSQAHKYLIWGGAYVVLFAEDWYGNTKESVGPLVGRENIILVGRIADGSVREDPETGDVTFDVISASGQAKNRDMYPIPVENDSLADEWYKVANLTVDRAAWFYITWHSTLSTICDWYSSEDASEISAMDFLAGDIYSALDSFYQDRLFARVLCDRYERFKADIDLQILVEGSGTTIMTLTDGDWFDEVQFREIEETPISIVEIGGINYSAGLITPFLAKAPGTVNRSKGAPFQNTSMAVASQASINTISGRLLAKMNSRWPEGTIPMGNWRVFDIWPQEYVVVNIVTKRHAFSSDNFIPRQITIDQGDGALAVTIIIEKEEGGVDGQTIIIPKELPTIPPPPIPLYPPGTPPTPTQPGAIDSGRRIVATDVGVFVTDEIGASSPVWYGVNAGFSTADDLNVFDIKRDPWHWWTTTDESTLWAGTDSGVWKHENFPHGTWVKIVTMAQLDAASGIIGVVLADGDLGDLHLGFSSEVDGQWAMIWVTQGIRHPQYECYAQIYNGGILNSVKFFATGDGLGINQIGFAPHGAGNKIYAVANKAPAHLASKEQKLWRSLTKGAAWSDINTMAVRGFFSSLAIPYVDASNTSDLYVLYGVGGGIAAATGGYRQTNDGGSSFTDLVTPFNPAYSILGEGGLADYLVLISASSGDGPGVWTNDNGVTYADLPLYPNVDAFGSLLHAWSNGQLQTVLVGTQVVGGTSVEILLWSSGQSAWTDKTGNLNSFSTGEIRAIERDTRGSA